MITNIARFEARFDSQCDSCGDAIHESDPMGYDKDLSEYICFSCLEERTDDS